MVEITHLSHGKHAPDEGEYCLLEAAAKVGGEEHTDHPECVSIVLAAFGRRWNDDLDDADRNRLLLGLERELVGTGPLPPEAEYRFAWRWCDWLIRHELPAWLDLSPGLTDHAAALRALPVVTSATVATTQPTIAAAGGRGRGRCLGRCLGRCRCLATPHRRATATRGAPYLPRDDCGGPMYSPAHLKRIL